MEGVAEYTRAAQEKGCDPATWAAGVCSTLRSAGEAMPSGDLAHVLVSHICWANDAPLAWKYLDKALSSTLAPPLLVLALLSDRVVPRRRARPVAYRLYMELIRRHTVSFASQFKGADLQKTMTSIDDVLHLSQMFSIQPLEPGVLVVEFVFCILLQLIDATIEDEDLEEIASEKRTLLVSRPQDMEIDQENQSDKRTEPSEKLQRSNGTVAIELIGHFFQQRVTYRLLCLARKNMPSQWDVFIHRLHLLVMNPIIFLNSTVSADNLLQLALQEQKRFSSQQKSIHLRDLISIGSSMPPGGYCHGVSRSSLWIPFDLFLEDCLDGAVAATNAIEIISGLVKSLRAVNGTAWFDAFLGLWIASLRLVQRERDPIEGPVPSLDSRLCILLSITTLAIADIVEEETFIDEECIPKWEKKSASGERRKDLVTSLQILGDYESLLVPPPSVVSAANQAAAKAMIFISGHASGNGFLDAVNANENMNLTGNMWHLIVESCISRNLLDTSAYYWSGYITQNVIQLPFATPNQFSSWSALMMGAPLTSSMVNVLENTPASSLAELEKIFEIAVNGSDDDKVFAAAVLCGASLVRGWNIQEHTVHLVVKLLSPAVPVDHTGCDSHLIGHAPMLNVILTRISPVDCVQVFSYHGLVPELAGALMAICEVFGSCVPSISWIVGGEEINAHSVFSNAFILLLRLWKFNHPSLEYCIMGDGPPVGSQLTPEYLLLLRNSRVLSGRKPKDRTTCMQTSLTGSSSFMHPIFVDSFPQLKVWHRQHQACLASTLSGLVHGTLFHQNVENLLNMMFRKMAKGHNPSVGPGTSGSSSLSSSSGTGSDDLPIRPKLPAWEIMEAVPFVVDAALTACSHGRLCPRELATGLKDLADFLPSSLATIVSYFSAEVTRGVWKPAHMNGSDWPSPAANLSYVEELIKKIVAATGADVPSLVVGGSSSASLPLPLAAFVSLTITYKLDKASERFLNLAGPALENLAASCPWPSMPIVAALWTQKVKRWSDFLVFSASRTVFHHNNDAVLQLVRSCFTATLGLSSTLNSSNGGGVGSLLGHGFGSHFSGGLSPVAPGILYLRIYRCIKDIILLSEQILSSLMLAVKDIAENVLLNDQVDKLRKSKYGMSYGQASLASAMAQVKVAASLGAMLVWLSGGSSLVQALIQEMLPSWFLSVHEFDDKARDGCVLYMLGGHALAYFAVLCGMFAWGIDATPVSRRRPRIISSHLKFLASALDGKISIGCDSALWRAYMSGFVGLIVECAPSWVMEVELDVLKRLSRGLRQWNQEELALALLGQGGVGAMGAAADMIIFGSE